MRHTPFGQIKDMNITEAHAGIRTLRNLILDSPRPVKGLRGGVIIRPYHLTRLVVHAEYQPCMRQTPQVGLVRKCGEVLSNLAGGESCPTALELDDFILPIGKK